MKPATKTLLVFLALVLVFFQYRLWFAEDGIIKTWRFKKNIADQVTQNQIIRQQNKILLNDIQDLKQGGSAIEEHARNDLGMIKEGEIFYRTVKK